MIAVVYGVCAVACYLLCYALCRERVQAAPPREAKRQSFASLAKALAGNRALTAVIGAALLLLLASLLGQGMNMYLFKDYFNSADMLSLVGFAGVLPMLALAPFAAKLSKRFGKKEAGCVGVGVAAAAYLLMWALRLRSVWAYIGLMLVGSVGVGFFDMVIWAFITDVIDYQEVRTGSRDDGTVYAVYSFARKLGQALAGGVVGFALAAIGYVSSTGHVVQTQPVREGIYTISTLVPGLSYLGGSLCCCWPIRSPKSAWRKTPPCCANGAAKRHRSRSGRAHGPCRIRYNSSCPVFPGHIYIIRKERGKHMKHILPINEAGPLSKAAKMARQPFPPALPAMLYRRNALDGQERRKRLLARPTPRIRSPCPPPRPASGSMCNSRPPTTWPP
ncbi:MAG: MFS transporter [Ruthenibacterium lactatiformans]